MTQDNTEATAKHAYLAGLIDGEGCIYARTQIRPHHKGANYQIKVYCLYLEVSMCHEPTIRWLHRTFGGPSVLVKKPYGTRRTVQYHWRLSNDFAVSVLKLAYPFLITKKRQAALAFKLREVMKQTAYNRGSHKWLLRDALIDQIHELNQRKGFGRAVETVRDAGSNSEMIQSGLHSDVQSSSVTAAD